MHVYVLDTGIRASHEEFRAYGGAPAGTPVPSPSGGSRVLPGFDAVGTGSTDDCHGHGTHVAAIAGGLTYGVAKNVSLHPVRVLDCSGRAILSNILSGMDWVAKNAIRPAVVHMSIEGNYNGALNTAVETMVRTNGIHVVTSSGNSARDACNASPASASSGITVAAVDSGLRRWSMGNYGG